MENILFFLDACKKLGVNVKGDLFTPGLIFFRKKKYLFS